MKRSCLILGSGRSGTSLTAGVLAGAGYYFGDTPLPATDANPKGYFESREVEWVNDQLVRTMLAPTRWERLWAWLNPPPVQPTFNEEKPWYMTRWLALVPPRRRPYVHLTIRPRIEALVDRAPYCFKDPRFCYTLPAWRPYLRADTVFLVVFREPAVTAASILKEVARETYLQGVTLTFAQAVQVWTYMYRHILEKHRRQGEWLFMHYDQVMTPAGLDRIAQFVGAEVDRSFPDPHLTRTHSSESVPRETARLYETLCWLADYRPVLA
ncbi:MAG: hypothetical protein JW910_15275 [Anaerolineae bacterium]|nr:hypothetical protein [Anaerolineae bacterium]